ncbi:hypothetical protein [Rhodococcus sp. NPDC055024]
MNAPKLLAVAAIGCALILTGCAGTDSEGNETPHSVSSHYVDLVDGRKVLCVWEKSGYAGGPSCDWGSAK